MKIIVFLFTAFLYFTSTAQYYENFDTITSDQLYYDTLNTDNHIWQIGQTDKSFFDNEWAVVTDTTNMYDSLTDATLNLTLFREDIYNGFALEFDHKLDTDLHHAGGFIEFNFDNDTVQYQVYENGVLNTYSTWKFIIDLNNTELFYTELGHKISAYDIAQTNGDFNEFQFSNSTIDTLTYADTLRQNINCFTGTYDAWEHVRIHLLFPLFVRTQDQADTLNLKFHFISDSLSNNKNGWAIKNIYSGEMFYNSLNENQLNSELIGYPTPTLSNYTVEIQNEKNKNVTIEVLNLNGKVIKRLIKKGERIDLDLSNLIPGSYIVNYFIENKYKGYSKVIKQ